MENTDQKRKFDQSAVFFLEHVKKQDKAQGPKVPWKQLDLVLNKNKTPPSPKKHNFKGGVFNMPRKHCCVPEIQHFSTKHTNYAINLSLGGKKEEHLNTESTKVSSKTPQFFVIKRPNLWPFACFLSLHGPLEKRVAHPCWRAF